MKTFYGVAVTLTLMILLYVIRKPALKWCFARDIPETPAGWEPKMMTWKNGIKQ